MIVHNIASLTLHSDTRRAADVSDILGLTPTRAGEQGELRVTSAGRVSTFRNRSAIWGVTFSSDGGKPGDDGYESLREIAATFAGKGELLAGLRADYSMRIRFTGTSDNLNTSFELPPDVLEGLTPLGVPLSVTVYPSDAGVLEKAVLHVAAGREVEFEAAFAEARWIVAGMPGCGDVSLSRGIEHPGTYLLLIRWETLEHHEVGFRGSPQYEEWKKLLHHFYEPFPVVEHYREVE